MTRLFRVVILYRLNCFVFDFVLYWTLWLFWWVLDGFYVVGGFLFDFAVFCFGFGDFAVCGVVCLGLDVLCLLFVGVDWYLCCTFDGFRFVVLN